MQVNNLAEFQIAYEQNPLRRVINTTKILDASETPIGIQTYRRYSYKSERRLSILVHRYGC